MAKVYLNGLIRKQESDYNYKSFKTCTHLFPLLFGTLSRCNSIMEVCEGLRVMDGKLNLLGMDQIPAKSTAYDGLRKRSHKFFEDLYFTLAKHYHSYFSDNQAFGLTFKKVLIVDSTTIQLVHDILKNVSCNPKVDGRKKDGMKFHMLIDAVQPVGRFIKMTSAKVHDQDFLKSRNLISNNMIVFDKAYNYYYLFALRTQQRVYYDVTWMKRNAVYTIIEVKREHYLTKGKLKVLRHEIIELEYHSEREECKQDLKIKLKMRSRKVCYQNEKNRYSEFLTNNYDISTEDVASLYKKRLGIGILVKKMKQYCQLHYFYGENENAIYKQVWCTQIVQLLLTVARKIAQAKKAFSIVASLVRIHLISNLNVNDLLHSTKRNFKIKSTPPGLQLSYVM